jgi:ABC-2 type transport system ATP-binding protein
MAAVIETHNLAKSFGRCRAVDGLSLSVERGDVFGFLGPNGAGKSTTIRILVGLVKPDGGDARVLGHDSWSERTSALRRVGSLVETPGLYKFLTGRENLELVSRMSGFGDGGTAQALELVGLADRADDKVKAYSHGMRQRLAIAQSLVGEPELLILDEPTTGLDPEGMREVRELIGTLSRERSMTIFLSSHLLHEVQQTCDKVAIINHGKLMLQGKVSELLSGSDTFELEVSDPDKAAGVIGASHWAELISRNGNRLSVRLESGRSSELNRALVEAGVGVAEMRRALRSLEDVYMSLTGVESLEPDLA